MKTLPVARHAALLREPDLLDAAILREHFPGEDRAVARIPHTQGLVGASETGLQRAAGNAAVKGFGAQLDSVPNRNESGNA
ncbi:hypothetical protein J8I87_27580 [Paraburkholderia sp. LEh10]|uniref:hypothetical protein n=1 Tax=Paraburkholderia sp. LEh10 TaxID=2821353 RepID=UPI001AE11E49|nr:hypothetical protein [Paraburkholderia sp. LEh10]MBP0593390.1 hypothetical protein [Paraburkholderia sp. LEh10]